jgi:hypothetical protein
LGWVGFFNGPIIIWSIGKQMVWRLKHIAKGGWIIGQYAGKVEKLE